MNEKKIQQILELCLWFLNPLLILMAITIKEIQPALFLQWIGRFHPLILHFPIVFGVLIIIYFLFNDAYRFSPGTEKLLLTINAFITVIVALCGILLSKQNSYDDSLISIHKWGGIAIALISWLIIYTIHFKLQVKRSIAIFFSLVLIVSAHKGAQLTHGVNVLNFPQPPLPVQKVSMLPDSLVTVYERGIEPIFEQKCIGCHGIMKSEAKLQLNTPENILKGSKNGDILKSNSTKEATLFIRIHLPQSDEKHMPPDGKLQLTTDEIEILGKWLKAGGNFKMKLTELAKEDSLGILIHKYAQSNNPTVSSKEHLADLKPLNTNYCTVNYIYNGTDDVEVNFFQGRFYDRESLKKLIQIKDLIINLNMQGMPLSKEDLGIIIQFTHLKQINLNYTNLELASLAVLKPMTNLNSISICGIDYDEQGLKKFLDGSKFTSVNLWSANQNNQLAQKIAPNYPAIKISVGDNLKDQFMKISVPIIEQDSSIIPEHLDIKMKHVIKGTVIRYTTDSTDPDSIKSSEYIHALRITKNTVLKAKAFRPGWIGSDVVQRTFYKSEIHPDTIFFIKNPDPKYIATGAKTLIDYELGETNSTNGRWLGYKDSDMEFVIGFKQAREIKEADFNALVNIGAFIFPPTAVSVEGSNDCKQFKNIAAVKYAQIKKNGKDGVNTYSCVLPHATSYKYYKFNVANLKKLPPWHAGKGTPAWIFIDELFLK